MSVPCAVCGGPAEMVEHRFRIPHEIIYDAPLYHFIDFATMEGEPFCGPKCATAFVERCR